MPRLSATSGDLPPGVRVVLTAAVPSDAPSGEPATIDVDGSTWRSLAWGLPSDPPVLLVHGVTSNAGIWWRVGPAIAAAGRRVVAVDMPGHGQGAAWRGRHRFLETAADLATFIRAAGLDVPALAVVGHSWGAMVVAHLPLAGLRPATLVLLDPPLMTLHQWDAVIQQPTEQRYETMDAARTAIRSTNPGWTEGDVEAKARSLTEFDPNAVLAVLLQNGDWDAGMAAVASPAASGIPVWLIRGEQATGSLIPDAAVPAMELQLGADRVITIVGGPHSPQRTHPEATLVALLRAIA